MFKQDITIEQIQKQVDLSHQQICDAITKQIVDFKQFKLYKQTNKKYILLTDNNQLYLIFAAEHYNRQGQYIKVTSYLLENEIKYQQIIINQQQISILNDSVQTNYKIKQIDDSYQLQIENQYLASFDQITEINNTLSQEYSYFTINNQIYKVFRDLQCCKVDKIQDETKSSKVCTIIGGQFYLIDKNNVQLQVRQNLEIEDITKDLVVIVNDSIDKNIQYEQLIEQNQIQSKQQICQLLLCISQLQAQIDNQLHIKYDNCEQIQQILNNQQIKTINEAINSPLFLSQDSNIIIQDLQKLVLSDYKQNKKIENVQFVCCLLNKINVLGQLYKIQKQDKKYEFYTQKLSNITVVNKNAYALLSKNEYMQAAGLFIVTKNYSDVIKIFASQNMLNDQLFAYRLIDIMLQLKLIDQQMQQQLYSELQQILMTNQPQNSFDYIKTTELIKLIQQQLQQQECQCIDKYNNKVFLDYTKLQQIQEENNETNKQIVKDCIINFLQLVIFYQNKDLYLEYCNYIQMILQYYSSQQLFDLYNLLATQLFQDINWILLQPDGNQLKYQQNQIKKIQVKHFRTEINDILQQIQLINYNINQQNEKINYLPQFVFYVFLQIVKQICIENDKQGLNYQNIVKLLAETFNIQSDYISSITLASIIQSVSQIIQQDVNSQDLVNSLNIYQIYEDQINQLFDSETQKIIETKQVQQFNNIEIYQNIIDYNEIITDRRLLITNSRLLVRQCVKKVCLSYLNHRYYIQIINNGRIDNLFETRDDVNNTILLTQKLLVSSQGQHMFVHRLLTIREEQEYQEQYLHCIIALQLEEQFNVTSYQNYVYLIGTKKLTTLAVNDDDTYQLYEIVVDWSLENGKYSIKQVYADKNNLYVIIRQNNTFYFYQIELQQINSVALNDILTLKPTTQYQLDFVIQTEPITDIQLCKNNLYIQQKSQYIVLKFNGGDIDIITVQNLNKPSALLEIDNNIILRTRLNRQLYKDFNLQTLTEKYSKYQSFEKFKFCYSE